jgi:glycosyltransferase involved in cell wall biosynthesis
VWNGDVWKAMYHVTRDYPELGHAVVDCDWGLGVLWRRQDGTPECIKGQFDPGIMDLGFDFFEANKNQVFNVVQPENVDALLRQLPAWSEQEDESEGLPLVSIMIPTYNQAEFLPVAVQSALDQDYVNLEVVISDDCSDDRTGEVLKRFEEDRRVRVFRNSENLGRVKNYRKTLYDYARGKFVLNLDGDDFLCDNKWISKAIEVLNSDSDVVLACARKQNLDIDGQLVTPAVSNTGFPRIMSGFDAFLALKNEDLQTPHSATIYKRSVAKNIGFYSYDIVSSDWESIHRLVLCGNVAVFDDVVSVWREHGSNASQNLRVDQRIQNITRDLNSFVFARSLGFPKKECKDWLRNMLSKSLMDSYSLLKSHADVEGFKSVCEAVSQVDNKAMYGVIIQPKVFLKILGAKVGVLKPKG